MALFGTDGVRGVAGVDLTADLALQLLAGFKSLWAVFRGGNLPRAIKCGY